jgi:hypothetical protein
LSAGGVSSSSSNLAAGQQSEREGEEASWGDEEGTGTQKLGEENETAAGLQSQRGGEEASWGDEEGTGTQKLGEENETAAGLQSERGGEEGNKEDEILGGGNGTLLSPESLNRIVSLAVQIWGEEGEPTWYTHLDNSSGHGDIV